MTTDTDQKLDAILNAIKNLEARVAHIEGGNSSAKESQSKASESKQAKKLSIREYLLEHPPTTDIQRTLAIGYFLEKYAGTKSFNKADLEKGYSDAKEPPPSNIGVNITQCIKKGHMMEAEEKKDNKTAYVVTRAGETFVESGYEKPS